MELKNARNNNYTTEVLNLDLIENEKLYHSMFEKSSSIQYLIDPETGDIIDANNSASAFYGYSTEQLKTMNISQINILSPEDITQAMNDAFQEKRNYFVFMHKLADGTIKDVEVYSNPLEISGRKILQAIVHDITESKKIAKAILISEQHSRALIEAIPDMIFRMNTEGIFLDYKAALDDLFVAPELFLGKKITEVLPDWLAVLAMEKIIAALSNNEMQIFEYNLPFSDNEFKYFECRMVPYSDMEVLAIVRNITENILARQKILESEANARAIMEATDDILVLIDKNGIVIDNNEVHAQSIGMHREELLGKNIYEYLPEYVVERRQKFVNQVIDTGQPFHGEDFRDDRWFEFHIYPISIDGKTTNKAAVFAKDITQRKQSEQQLAEMAAQWQSTFDAVNDAIWLLDKDQNVIRSNKSAGKLFQMPSNHFIGKKCYEIVHGTDSPIMGCPIQKAYQSANHESAELQIGEKWFQISGDPIVDENGRYSACIHIVSDITERKNAEEKLKNSYDLLRLAGTTARFGGWNVDLKTNMVTWSDQVAEIHERPYGYSPPVEEGISYYTSEYRDKITEVFTRCATEGIPYDEVMRIRSAKNNLFWVRTLGEAIRDNKGNITGVHGAFQDISDIKQKENIQEALLHLTKFVRNHSFDELLEEVLNVSEKLTDSMIGFFHLVADDQENLVLQNWSTRTKSEFCIAKGKGMHYPISEAGVWVDCVHLKQPVIHNDYASLTHKKGIPEGHANVIREMVFPLMQNDKILAIMGVGNKPTDYNDRDIEAVSQLMNLVWDIYLRKKTEEALTSSEDRFRKIFEESPVGMALVSKEFKFLRVNSSFCDFIQYTEEELINMTFVQITHSNNVINDREAVKKVANGEMMVYQTEKKYIRKDNQLIWGEAHISAIRNNDGTFRCFLAIIKDISQRKLDEMEIIRINDDLKELNATKDKLFSIIAHDLKSPFNAILGFSAMLTQEARTLDIGEIENYSAIINTSAEQTFRLLENLLDWARMQQGNISFIAKHVIPVELIQEVLSLVEENARLKQIRITSLVPEHLIIHADEDMMKTIFRNLISNAIKFSHVGGNIEIMALPEDSCITFSIRDHGTGISPENIGKLFKIGSGFTMRGTNNEKGTGLGLLLCREFVEKHGGTIWVESEAGRGSTFCFTIPYNQNNN